ncbi:pentatricopeptide repeat-containing protein At1g34160 [Beta vulgaris subsp. vulgaris]|uniref:pentatricopeptide repeat-containing protein At1g34160 n=1 Tax=Beta vulgaris subsp. vulgaris TaxID=3555 RepID=UPI0020373246|nr:pentatricopeptide repeat-containing protein At1g34160 [Beta vulgaris subsp. vulgaris]XP_048499272.1 pentatricopeptide repeat-containing protein At1g34160 [Beta vulgaris subsp. vulgaris]
MIGKHTTIFIETALQKCNSLSHIKQIQSHLISTSLFQFSLSSRSKLLELTSISSYGDLSYATLIFNYINHPLIYDYNALIRGHAQSSNPQIALYLFLSMLRASQKPDALTCSFVLKACARALAKFECYLMHSLVFRSGFMVDMLLQTTLMDVYCKVGEFRDAKKVFDEMPKRDIVSWNALICGLAQGSFPNEALKLFYKMLGTGLNADEITVLGALSACSQMGALKEGDKIWCFIKEEKLDMKVVVCNAGIDMYSKCGFVDRAYEVFRTMRCKKNVITWNTMVMGFAMHGHGIEAIALLKEMECVGVFPDTLTYLGVLCACNHAGLVDEGFRLFNLMEEKGIVRNVKHYGTVVDLLGRAGRLNEAYGIINSMPIVPDVVLWQTLLGACKTYGNVELAEIASRKLVEMGSDSCGDFVLLSNVYATYKRWNDVGRVREAMNSRVLKKVPGFSYTEVGGILHKFINGDRSHPSWREIYAKLDEIMYKIKEHGYVPGTRFVLHDIGEEDKEYVLSYHSEKLAVAFALLKSSQETPIQVIKNLRICVDCHAVLKLVSKVYNREIIVRDRARFHRFKEGTCSCKDYW